MPGYDGTGPAGAGPRTGGGFGYCTPGIGPTIGRWLQGIGRGGFPWGCGRGLSWGGSRRGFFGLGRGFFRGPSMTLLDEAAILTDHIAALETALSDARERYEAIKKSAKEKKE